MDERLNRSNRLPGSEKLTRPEEIGQLSKYLKSIKEVYEESTRLEDQVVGVSGSRTGRIPTIDSLEGKSIKTPENQGESVDLSRKILGVPGKSVEVKENLESKRINLVDPDIISELDDRLIVSPENHGGEVTQLGKVIKKIQDIRDQELGDKKLNLLDERFVALENTRLDLQAMINTSLGDKRLDLKDDRGETELEDKRVELEDERNLNLTNRILKLGVEDNIELPDKRLDIQDEKVDSLETKRIGLSAEGDIELGNKRINLTDSRQIELKNTRVDIRETKDVELGGKRIDLGGSEKEVELGKKRLNLEEPGEIDKLGDKKINLSDSGRTVELEDKRINLNEPGNIELVGKRINLSDLRQTELENTRLNISDNRTIELETTRKDISDNRGVELRDKRLDLKDSRNIGLEGKSIKAPTNINGEPAGLVEGAVMLKVDNNPELETTRKDISDDRGVELEGKKIELVNEEEIELENTRIDISDDKTLDLSNKILGLTDDRTVELGDKRINISDSRQTELGDKRIDLRDERETKLTDKKIELEDDRGTKLEDKKVELQDDREESLSDKILSLADDRKIRLGDKKLELRDDRKTELREKRVDLQDDREINLVEKKLGVSENINGEPTELYSQFLGIIENQNEEPDSLSTKIIGKLENQNTEPESLSDKLIEILENYSEEPNSLSTKILEIIENQNEAPGSLSTKILELLKNQNTEPDSLPDKILEIIENQNEEPESLSTKILEVIENQNKEVDSLSDKLIDIEENQNEEVDSLSDKLIDIEENQNEDVDSLSDRLIGILENQNEEPESLSTKILKATENQNKEVDSLSDELIEKLENQNEEVDSLSDKLIDIEENQNEEVEELSDRLIDIEENQNEETESLSSKLLKVEENKNPDYPDLDNSRSLKEYTSKLSDNELYEFAMKVASEGEYASGETDGWLQKVESLMSSYLSSDILTPKRAIEFRDAINNTLEMSYFGSQVALRAPIDTSSGTIWAKAEEMVGDQITGTNRRDALDEMIVKLVDYKKSNLPKIPGSDLEDMAKDAGKNVVGIITGETEHLNPINKPLSLNGLALPGGPGDTLYQAANNRTNANTIDPVGDTIGNAFYVRYWKSDSFKATLEELCPIVGKAPIASLMELKAILKSSPYFTSPGKFMTDTKGSYNTFSLDTNMYWEVTIQPYCSSSGTCSNGGFSFLPSIKEINLLNKKIHDVSTNYGYWAPINSFELQKAKLSTKSLSLYEGEISYPTGMEFSNELRLTFVDDAWKSWKRYFERCAEVAVYNSEAHDESYYTGTPNSFTKIDKTYFCVSSYKNIAFNIKIFILNPQLNLLNKFDLLCVLKDYSEEYVGEVDSGGTDLNVTFSIVGENPQGNMMEKMKVSNEIITNLAIQAGLEAQKRVTGAIRSSVGLL